MDGDFDPLEVREVICFSGGEYPFALPGALGRASFRGRAENSLANERLLSLAFVQIAHWKHMYSFRLKSRMENVRG